MNPPRTIAWVGDTSGFVRLLDQTQLPTQLVYRDCRAVEEVWEAIKTLRVRGAPAIGVAAALGVGGGMQTLKQPTHEAFRRRLREVTDYLATSRPTAVNLFWALDRMRRRVDDLSDHEPPVHLLRLLLDEALAIEEEDRQMCRAIGRVGAAL